MDSEINRSLQRLSILSYSKWFWDKPENKNKLKYFSSCFKNSEYTFDYWKKLIKSVASNLKTSQLPGILLNELNYSILSMGWRMYQWRVFVTLTLCLPEKFTEPVYWTPYGTIDKAKIVEKEWLNFGRVTRSMESKIVTAIHYMACSCALGSHIIQFRAEIMDENYLNNEFFKKTEVMESSSHSFIKNSLLFFDKSLTAKSSTTAQSMFEKSITLGNDVAAQFYWNLLDPEEASKDYFFTLEALMDCLNRLNSITMKYRRHAFFNPHYHAEYCRRLYYRDTFVSVVVQMLKLQRKDFFLNKRVNSWKIDFFETFVSEEAWPWQELFFPLFKIMKDMFDLSDYYKLLDAIFIQMKFSNNYLVCDVQKGVQYKMYLTVWNALQLYRSVENAPLYPFNNSNGLVNDKYEKEDSTLKDHNERTKKAFIRMVYSAHLLFNVDILKQIIDSECDEQGRLFFFSEGNYERLIRDDEFELLDKFLKIVVKDEERDWFYKTNDFFTVFINKDEFKIVENVLNWILSSEENLKNQFDVIWVCSYLYFKDRTVIIEKAMNQCFSNEEQKDQYLHDYDNVKWLFEGLICHGESKTSEFLDWFTGSKKKSLQFRKKLINGASVESYLKLLVQQRHKVNYKSISNEMNRLFKYCSLSRQKIKNLRENFTNNINYFVLFLNRSDLSLVKVEDFLSWLYKKKTKVFIKKFLHSPDAVNFFKDILRYGFQNSKDCLSKWIKISGDVKTMESYVDEAYEAVVNVFPGCWCNFRDLKLILDELKK